LSSFIKSELERYPGISADLHEVWSKAANDPSFAYAAIELLLSSSDANSPFCRAVDNYRVYYVPAFVREVTSDFE
jgi:hypothetical protein